MLQNLKSKKRLKSKYIGINEVVDPYSEKDTEVALLNSKPTCFLITGKPGSGCSTLAKTFADAFQCEYINPKDIIDQHLNNFTDKGKELQALLEDGGVIDTPIVLELIQQKIDSPEVAHKGYILDGFPNTNSTDITPVEQFEMLKNFKLQPDFLIYMKIPDGDITKRLQSQRIDPESGTIYFKQNYDPDFPPPLEVLAPVNLKKPKSGDDEEEEEEEEEEEAEDEEEMMEEGEEGPRKANPDFELLDLETIKRLLKRPEDFEENVMEKISNYTNNSGKIINDYIDNFNSINVINLNANNPPEKNFRQLMERLRYYTGIRPAAVVTPLYYRGTGGTGGEEEDEEEEEDPENQPPESTDELDELFRELSTRLVPSPGYRWQRSEWGIYCPVSLYEGNLENGKPKYAAAFLNKVYLLSNEARLKQFIRNPRPYLLPPNQPNIPCRLIITGPSDSGKSSIAHILAKYYDASVIDINKLMEPHMEEARKKHLEETKERVTKEAIESVKNNVKAEIENQKSEEMANDVIDKLHEDAVDAVEDSAKEKLILENSDPNKDEDDKASQDTIQVASIQEEEVKDLPQKLPEIIIEENDPRVQELVERALEVAAHDKLTLPNEIYCQEIEKAITDNDEKLKETNQNGKIHGSWIIDNFPMNKDIWSFILESEPEKHLQPNQVIVLRDKSEKMEYILNLWYQNHKEFVDNAIASRNIDKPVENDISKQDQPDIIVAPPGPEKSAAKIALDDWNKEWESIATMIDNNNGTIKIIDMDIENKPVEGVNQEIIKELLNIFKPQAAEWTTMDTDDADEDLEVARGEDEEEEEEEEEQEEEDEDEGEDDEPKRSKKKPLGDTSYWCPVTLHQKGVITVGDPEIAAKYLGKMYYFTTEENRDLFLNDPNQFIPVNHIPKAPPIRLLLLGVKGVGKTLIGRELADKLKIFHISFHELLQEFILPKNKKKVGLEYNEEEPVPDFIFVDPALEDAEYNKSSQGAKEAQEEQQQEVTGDNDQATEQTVVEEEKEGDKEPEVVEEEWNEMENAIKDYLENRTPLTEEILNDILSKYWTQEPFKSIGFILEGFPKTSTDVEFLQNNSFLVDGTILLKGEETDNIVERILKPLMDKWRERKAKKDLYKQKSKEYQQAKKNYKMEKRRQEIILELEAKRSAKLDGGGDEDMGEDEEDLDEEVNIDEMLAEEFGEDEEEEEEDEEDKTEEEVEEEMRDEIQAIVDQDSQDIEEVIESLKAAQIPRFSIDPDAKIPIVKYRIEKKLEKFLDHRESIFERCYPLKYEIAQRLIKSGYKQPSCFGNWCPVRLASDQYPTMPVLDADHPTFPVLYRSHIYFLSSKKNRDDFMNNPLKYLKKPTPKHCVPIKLCLVGLLKTGKTTVANRFVREYNIIRVTGGEALRKLLNENWNSDLAKEIRSYLIKGLIVPHELVVKAIDIMLMDVNCVTRGYVLDGYPFNIDQVKLLEDHNIIPNRIYEFISSPRDLILRATKDRAAMDAAGPSVYPLPRHDSPKIIAIRIAKHESTIGQVREWYGSEYHNYRHIDANNGKWIIWDTINKDVKHQIVNIQNYLYKRNKGYAACIYDLGVRPSEFESRMSALKQYCPVSLAHHGELVNMAQESWSTSLRYAAEYKGLYYKTAGPAELADFLRDANEILESAKQLPDYLPRILDPTRLEELFPMKLELQGYCPVCFLNGKCRYEGLVMGNRDKFIVEYRGVIFAFCTEACVNAFMRFPHKYWNLELPKKLPPVKNPINIRSLPLPGYLEQTMADALRNALTATGTLKPKYPFINPSRSALLYIALHLKAYNPASAEYLRKKYKRKLEQFEDSCELIRYLSDHMTLKYKEVEQRPAGFDRKMSDFLNLKQLKDNEDRWINSD